MNNVCKSEQNMAMIDRHTAATASAYHMMIIVILNGLYHSLVFPSQEGNSGRSNDAT